MCDYSLAGIPNRLAVEGEELVVRRFPTGSIGLASPCESSKQSFATQTPAVCVPPGARLRLRDIREHSSVVVDLVRLAFLAARSRRALAAENLSFANNWRSSRSAKSNHGEPTIPPVG